MKEKILNNLFAVKKAFNAFKIGFKRDLPCEKLFENFTNSLDCELKNYSIKYDYLCGKDTVNIDGASNGYYLKDGDTVLMDISVGFNGVWCDVTRTYFVGGYDSEQEKAFNLIARSIDVGANLLKGGARANDIYNAVNGVYQKVGKKLIHHAGHRIGQDCLLQPQFLEENLGTINVGDAVAIESGLYDGFGIRLENDYYILENGAQDLFGNLMPLDIKEYVLK